MNDDIIIDIQNVSVRFNKATENISGLKEYVIKLLKGQLMFQEFLALKNINLQIRKGESWGIVGNNGAGKSTLLKLICGILDPYEGHVFVRGNIAPLIELGAGFDAELTARENIYLNGLLLGYTKDELNFHFDEIVAFSELKDFLDMPVKNYSSGMIARLGFSIATAKTPDILIVDEVLAVGDADFQKKCQRRIEGLLKDGTTLLFVSHTIGQVQGICQMAAWLHNGDLVEKGEVSSVTKHYGSVD